MPFHRSNPFAQFVSKGVAGIRAAREQQLKTADDRARKRIATAKTRAEQSRIRAELALERLKLERQAFEAEARVIQARAETNKARIAAGRLNPLERTTRFIRRTGESLQQLQAANERRANPPRRRAATKKSAPAKKPAAKKPATRKRRDPDDLSDLFR